jgi:serralysin
LNNNQVQFKVEEDTSADAEMAHTTENVSFLAIEGSGILSAVSIDPLAPMTAAEAIVASPETFTGSPEADTFILGNATQSYYDNMGIQDYALILNFDSSEDVIQLHGSASDYQLGAAPEEVPQGTGIFLNNDELVGVVSGVSDLALDSNSFSFV